MWIRLSNASNLWSSTFQCRKRISPLTSILKRLYLLNQTISAGRSFSTSSALARSCW